jgi:hypothetical protein
MAFQTSSKHFQKAVILVLLITFTTLLYHYQRFFSYPPIHRISQDINNSTHSPLSSSSSFQHEYSIKPIAYIFPQYYPFPENDKIWGTNFTEWDNVRKATHNNHGLETIRPDESVGYYNGVDHSTRERQGRFLRESGFYGAAFHHYWFAGKPVMDGVTKAMLEDGEPRIPFMLSWANEPWTARWDGEDSSETFIAQDYGNIEDWRKHFEYLLPFFKHPLYIRSGGRIQFMVYKPSHCGHIGPHIFAAWRQWALDEGLGGLDVIETRWGSGGEKSSNQAIPDAISEFQPHVAGFDHAHHSVTDRVSRVYHRGTLVCWDATPRHVNDGQGRAQPTCHPKTWMWNIVEMMRKIKSEPNPLGAENFLFVNALNEWGEGNALEPSKQFGDGYGKAMKGAIEISEKEHIWQHQEISQGILRAEELKSLENATTDVCVLIRTYRDQADDKTYRLSHTLRSLQAQTNNNWRALVFRTDETDWWNLNEVVFTTLDPRIKLITLDKDIQGAYSKQDAAFTATDWMIKNLTTADPLCASARYLLVTNGGVTYEKNTFEVAVPKRQNPDLIGLNVESRDTIFNHTALQGGVWDDRCKRLEDVRTFLNPLLSNLKTYPKLARTQPLRPFRPNTRYGRPNSNALLPPPLPFGIAFFLCIHPRPPLRPSTTGPPQPPNHFLPLDMVSFPPSLRPLILPKTRV